MSHTWDPDRYLDYADQRGRPFVELLARVGAESVARVVDLGCGPGNLTSLLAQRWPDAAVVGIDSSAEMVDAARRAVGAAAVSFEVADLRSWVGRESAQQSADVVVSNATLQWLPDHLDLLPALVRTVRPGGWLAFQVPGNGDEPSHTLRDDLAAEAPYAAHLDAVMVPHSHDPAVYLDALVALGCDVDAWETTYLHVLDGPDPVFAWVSSTGARPTLQALPDDLRPGFESELRRRLREAYPAGRCGVVMAFRRVFVVARVPRRPSGIGPGWDQG